MSNTPNAQSIGQKRYFRLYWLTGETEIVSATWIDNRLEAVTLAVNNAGYGSGAIRALDYWCEVSEDEAKEESEGAKNE